MAGQAFRATERQFLTLLDAASDGIPIHVSFLRLPGLSQAEAGGSHFASHYASVDTLWDTHLDGLIVTGREPKTAHLQDEPYWQSFTQVLEWAQNNTHSAIWSCLAAHAAVLHMDGIRRVKASSKHFGVFDCVKSSSHPLTSELQTRFDVPHSRWNGLTPSSLQSHGYTLLSTAHGSVDCFIKEHKSLFVFFQGHPEYNTDTLLREYRRDAARYLRGEAPSYPLLPGHYFDNSTEKALMDLRHQALSGGADILDRLTAALENAKIENTWRSSGLSIYRNWLREIAARKELAQTKHFPAVAMSAS
jgi:homoserine O-succinyltransferase